MREILKKEQELSTARHDQVLKQIIEIQLSVLTLLTVVNASLLKPNQMQLVPIFVANPQAFFASAPNRPDTPAAAAPEATGMDPARGSAS